MSKVTTGPQVKRSKIGVGYGLSIRAFANKLLSCSLASTPPRSKQLRRLSKTQSVVWDGLLWISDPSSLASSDKLSQSANSHWRQNDSSREIQISPNASSPSWLDIFNTFLYVYLLNQISSRLNSIAHIIFLVERSPLTSKNCFSFPDNHDNSCDKS